MAAITGWSADGGEIQFVANATAWYEARRGPLRSATAAPPRELNFGHARSLWIAPAAGHRTQRLRSGALEALPRRHVR